MKFVHPLVLLALPLALLALSSRARTAIEYPWLVLTPQHRASTVVDWLLRALMLLAIGALTFSLARPYTPEARIERYGRGAQIVLLLDRSRSMDEAFMRKGETYTGGVVGGNSKSSVAQHLLTEFTANRPHDLFGMVAFSGIALPIIDFTQKQELIRASITAGALDKGLSETDIGRALLAALHFFDERAYSGSRIVLLVSDGGDRIDVDLRNEITRLARLHRVGLYWIYLRSARSPGLKDLAPEYAETVPEFFLHQFFQSLGTPYRVYEAQDPEALASAIADVSRLETLPIRYEEVVARKDLSHWGYAIACAALLLLFTARFVERRSLT